MEIVPWFSPPAGISSPVKRPVITYVDVLLTAMKR
jgi:hypothetical protein